MRRLVLTVLSIAAFAGPILWPGSPVTRISVAAEGDASPKPAKDKGTPITMSQPFHERAARLIDRAFFDGKIDKDSKTFFDTAADPKTYKDDVELAYGMNPWDFFVHATSDYKKELVFDTVCVVVDKVMLVDVPAVGFQFEMSLETLKKFTNLKKDEDLSKIKRELKVKFFEGLKKVLNLEGRVGQAYDMAFLEYSANDAMAQIRLLSKSFSDVAAQLERYATELEQTEQNRQKELSRQIDDANAEIERLKGLMTPDQTPERQQELKGQIQKQQEAVGSLQQQLQQSIARLKLAKPLQRQAAQHRQTAQRLDRVGDGVKENLPILLKLADYLQRSKEGIPVGDVEEMIEIFQQVGKKQKDWKGQFEDLYEVYKTKGLGELENMAIEQLMAAGGAEVEKLRDQVSKLEGLGSPMDGLKKRFDDMGELVVCARSMVGTFYQVVACGARKAHDRAEEAKQDRAKRGKGAAGPSSQPAAPGKSAQAADGEDSADGDDPADVEAAAKMAAKAIELADQEDDALASVADLQSMLGDCESLGDAADHMVIQVKDQLKEMLNKQIEAKKKELNDKAKKYLAKTDLGKAYKWAKKKQKEYKEKKEKLAKEWAKTIEVLTGVRDLIDTKMPVMDLCPEKPDAKENTLGWFGGKGTTYTGFALLTDEGSGINPDSVHLFWHDEQDKSDHEIKDIKVIPDPGATEEFAVRATRIHKAQVRYRFDPPAKGQYTIWGYARDRAGHATCAVANARYSAEKNHSKWKYVRDNSDDHKFLKVLRGILDFFGCDPDQVFRKQDFDEVRLFLKEDTTPPIVTVIQPHGDTDPDRPLAIEFTVEDMDSWFNPDDVGVFVTNEYNTKHEWELADSSAMTVTEMLKDEEKSPANDYRRDKTHMLGRAKFVLDGPVMHPRAGGIYYLCVQVTNGAHITDGAKAMIYYGVKPPYTLSADISPPKATYEFNDQVKLKNTFWNFSSEVYKKVTATLTSAPGILTVVQKEPMESSGEIGANGHMTLSGTDVFKVNARPQENQKVILVYKCVMEPAKGAPTTDYIKVPIDLFDVDAEKVKHLKGALHYKYQDESRPVPFGTALSVSQVYQMPALGTPKWVEQYIGYGDVANDAGEFFINIRPEGKPPYRMRLVAKSYSHAADAKRGASATTGMAGVFTLESSMPFTCITPTIDVHLAKENIARGNVFDVGTQMIPYYSGYLKSKSRLIPINWEGELSTNGMISPYGHDFASNPYLASSDFLQAIGTRQIEPGAVQGQVACVPDVMPGVNALEDGIRHANFNGSLAILGTLTKSYQFTDRNLAYLAKDASPYQAARIPLAYEGGRPQEGDLTKIITTPAGLKVDRSIPNLQTTARTDFPFSVEVVKEKHVKETFYEEHEFVYHAPEQPPGVANARPGVMLVPTTRESFQKVKVRVLLLSDTRHDRVVLMDPSSGASSAVLSGRKEPVSAQEIDDWTYLVCLRGENLVGIFRNGKELWNWGGPHRTIDGALQAQDDQAVDRTLQSPEFAWTTPTGNVLICEGARHRIQEIDTKTNRPLWAIDQLVYPVMATMTPKGTILAVDRDAHQVIEFDTSGKTVWSFGENGSAGTGMRLNKPQSAVRLVTGDTFIADAGNQRVIKVDPAGKITMTLGPLSEVTSDPVTKKQTTVSVPLDKLNFADRYTGVNYILNGDSVYAVNDKGEVRTRAGGDRAPAGIPAGTLNMLGAPEHTSFTTMDARKKIIVQETEEYPYYEWRESVKIVKKPTTRAFIGDSRVTINLEPKDREKIPGIGATANYAPGHLLAKEHGLYTTGPELNKGRPRIYVNGGNDNADDNDPHVVARAYGAMLRNKLIRSSMRHLDYSDRHPCSPEEAWERSWDTFLACAINENAKFVDRDFLGKEIAANSLDLQKTYDDMLDRYRNKPEEVDRDFGLYRGLDSPYAMALLLEQIYKKNGAVVINHAITYARGGTDPEGNSIPTGGYIDPATLLALYPDMKQTFEVLGLVPRLLMKFPASTTSSTGSGGASTVGVSLVDTLYPRLSWETNGLLHDLDRLQFELVIAEDKPDNVVSRIPGINGQEWDFGKILKPDEVAAKLAAQFSGQKVYYWRVEAHFDDGPVKYRCSSPWGAFQIEVKTQVIKDDGGEIPLEAANSPLRQYGKVTIPPGALDRAVTASVAAAKLPRDLGDFQAVHWAAFQIDTAQVRFRTPARISFQVNDKDLSGLDPRGLGIYRYERATNEWEYVGGKLDKNEISADIGHTSIYAVLFDKRGPEFLNVDDGPDPAYRRDTLVIHFGVRKPTRTTIAILDSNHKKLRNVCSEQLFEGRLNEMTLPLADLPEGRYFYELSGSDPGGREATRVVRTFLVSDAQRGAIKGTAPVTAGTPTGALHVYIPDTSISFTGSPDDGGFLLEGVPPGKHELVLERPGLLPAKATAEVRSDGSTTDIGDVPMSDHALAGVEAEWDVFTPATGDHTYAKLNIEAERPCAVSVLVRDETNKIVCTLAKRRDLTVGRNVVLWSGTDDRGKPARSGWYTLGVSVDAGGALVAAGRARVLLDRGLVKNVVPAPRIFSPAGEGFENEVQLTYLLDAEALVSAAIYDSQGRLVATPADKIRQRPGYNSITWNGRSAEGKPVPDGRYSFTIQPAYPTGQLSMKQQGEVLANSTPPEILEISPANGTTIHDGRPTISAKVRLSELLDTGSLRLKIDQGTVRPSAFNPKTGAFSFQPATSLGEGVHIAIAYARDLAGNEAPPKAVSFTISMAQGDKKLVDRAPPTLKLLTPAHDEVVYTRAPLISAALNDQQSGIDDANIVVHFDGQRVCNNVKFFIPGTSGKDWDWYYYEKAIILYDNLLGEMRYIPGMPLPPGKHHVRIEAVDRAGNPAKAAEAVFTVVADDKPPKITELAPTGVSALPVDCITAFLTNEGPSGIDTGSIRMLVDGDDVQVDPAMMYDPKTGQFTCRLPQPLTTGAQHVVYLSARNRAGLRTDASAQVLTIVKDTQPPRIDLHLPVRDQTISPGAVVTAAVYDIGLAGLDESALSLKIDQQAVPRFDLKKPQAGGYQFRDGILEYTLPDLPAGAHTLAIGAADRAGNRSPQVAVGFVTSAKEKTP